MQFNEFKEKWLLFMDEYKRERVSIPLRAALTASSIAKNRVVETGRSSTGSVFGVYAKSTQRRKKRSNRANLSSFPNINFSQTNKMWRTTLPQIEKVSDNRVTITIKPTDSQRAKIMEYHNKRFEDKKGHLAALNKEETENLLNDYKEELDKLYKKFLS